MSATKKHERMLVFFCFTYQTVRDFSNYATESVTVRVTSLWPAAATVPMMI